MIKQLDFFLSDTPTVAAKRPAEDETAITNLRTKKERNSFLQRSLPETFQNQIKWNITDPRAQKFHKSIFDNIIILDLQPFSVVNKPGFLRHNGIMERRFELAGDKYYR